MPKNTNALILLAWISFILLIIATLYCFGGNFFYLQD